MVAAGRTARAGDAARRQAAHRPSGGAAVERRAACVVMLNKFGMAAAFKCPRRASAARRRERPCPTPAATASAGRGRVTTPSDDRKSVGEGKSGSVRVYLGGRA